jgi:dihydroxyacetone kinase-like predicted kinase
MLRTDISTHLLSDGDAENAAAALAAAAANLEAIERELSAAEDLIWQPHWSKNDPLPERLRRVGVTDTTARTLLCLIEGLDAFCRGEPMPAETNTVLDQQEQAERSANKQLAVVLNSRSIGTSMAAKMGVRMGARLRSKRSHRFEQ